MSHWIWILFFVTGALRGQVPDVTISRIEVVQTIQDDEQSVPLVAGKATAVRVFVRQAGQATPLISNVTAVVRGLRGGVEIPLSPLRPVNPAISAQVSPDRNNPLHSLDLIMPLAWTEAGKLELRAELRLPSGVFEFPSDNNNAVREVEFVATATPSIVWLPLCTADGRCATGALNHTRLMQKLFPYADGTLRYTDVPVPAVRVPVAPDTDEGSVALLAHLEKWRILLQESPLKPDLLVGWLPRGTKTVAPGGGAGGTVWVVEQSDAALSEQVLARQFAAAYAGGDSCGNTIQEPGYDPVASRLMTAARLEFTSYCTTAAAGVWTSVGLAKFLAGRPVPGAVSAEEPSFLVSVAKDGAARTRLREGGMREMARLSTAGDAPTVSITAPVPGENVVRWSAADAEGRSLTYLLSYSNDDGATWTPLGVDLTETEFAFDPAVMLQGNLRFRVQASAGVDVGSATTDAVNYQADPTMELPATTFDLGSVTTLTYAERGVRVRNTGKGPLVLQNFASSDAFPVVTPVPFTVRAGTERQLWVRAFPRVSGGDTATLTADTNDPANPSLSVTLRDSAYDRPVPSITVSVLSLDFGQVSVGQTREMVFALGNEGTAPLTVTSLSTLNARFAVVSPTAQFQLQPGELRAVTARFTPNAGGVQVGSLSIGSNDPSLPSHRIDLRGEGLTTTTPAIEVSTTALDFGSLTAGQVQSRSTTVRNAGTGVLSVNSLNIDNGAFRVASPVGPFTLNAGGTQVISIQFAPSAAGAQSGELAIASNDPARPRVTVTLTGTATAVGPAPSPRITTLIPSSIQRGGPRFNLTVTGTNFTEASMVTWNGANRPTVYGNSTRLMASIAPEDVANATAVTVGVTNPAPGGASNTTLQFVVNPNGASAQIVNMDLSACPVITSTLTAYDNVGLPITVLDGGNINCSEDGTGASCGAIPALNLGSRLSVQLILHATADYSDPAARRISLLNQRRIAQALVKTMTTVDRVGVSQFDNGVRSLIDFTEADSRDALLDAIDGLRDPIGSGSALYEAVSDAVRRLNGQTGRRKAIVVFSTSTNTYPNAQIPYDDLARLLQSSGIPVYTFPLGTGATNNAVVSILNQFAVDSNGRMFNDQELDQASVMSRLAETLSNQQFVTYTTPRPDGTSHTARFNIAKEGAVFSVLRAYPGCPAR